MKKTLYTFKNQEYVLSKSADDWCVILKQSDILIRSEQELLLLEAEHPCLMPVGLEWQEDILIMRFPIDDSYTPAAQLKHKMKSDKLRGLLNVIDMATLIKTPVATFFHPENLVLDRNLVPKVLYRGLREKMPPKNLTEEDFLRQMKCLAISLFSDENFTTLYDGQLEICEQHEFTLAVKEKKTVSELKMYLEKLYQATLKYDQQHHYIVPQKKYRLFQQLAIWMSAATVIMLVPLIYFMMIKTPFQQKLLETDTAFVKKDYDTVISLLAEEKIHNIPVTQKYEITVAVIESQQLTDDQKNVLLNNVSLKSDEDYLNFWLYIGRGELDESLDSAKNLEDVDLILFALMEKQNQVRNDTTLTGGEKEELITSIESDIETFTNKRRNILEETDASKQPTQTGRTNADTQKTAESTQKKENSSARKESK